MLSTMLRAEDTPAGHPAPSVVRRENPLERPDWDVWISSATGLTPFHGAGWAEVLHRTYGFRPVYFTATRGRRLSALLPVMEVNSWLTGKRGVSLPFTDFCEPLGEEEAVKDLFKEALEHGRKQGWRHFELRSGDALFQATAPSLSFHGHRMSLHGGIDFLFSKLQSPVRRAIRKAENSGLSVEASQSLEAVRAFYSLHCRTRRQHGLPPQPFRFFRNIQEQILAHNHGAVISASWRGRPIASSIFLYRGTEALYKFGASDKRHQELRAGNLVMWEAIKWLALRGMRTLRFGRTSLADEGLRRYKLGWGTEEYRINYYKYDLRRKAFVADDDSARGWHNSVFRALPVFAARWAGAILYRHAA
jgi:hypothetical protein